MQFIHSADLPGDSTDHVQLDFYDGGTDGTGTDAVATRGGDGTTWTAGEVYGLPLTATQIDAGNWLTFTYTEAGTIAFTAVAINVVYREHANA